MIHFADLPHATRFAIRQLCERLGARVEGYESGHLTLSMPMTDDRKGWSADAAALNRALLALGLERVDYRWRHNAHGVDDPWRNYQGYLFTTVYRIVADPLPLCSAHSKGGE